MPDGWDGSLDTDSAGGLPGGRSRWSAIGPADGPGRRDLVAGAVCLFGALLAGPVIGLVWAATSPRLDVGAVLDGSSAALDAQSAIDIYFAMTCALFGVIVGVLAFWRFADAGWPVPAGLAAGGLGGSLIAGRIGHQIRSGSVLDRLPQGASDVIVDLVDVRVRAQGLYLVFPVVALFVLALAIWIGSVRARSRLAAASAADDAAAVTDERRPG